ncbi:MAG: CvpA family protein [Clostridiaceae bacterium]|nr:CvpA family protein [Clostridiaceae bacterium]
MNYRFGKPRPVAQTMNRMPAVLLLLAVISVVAIDLIFDIGINWVDYILIAIIALFGFKGYLKGLVNTVFSLGGYILALIAAAIFSPKLSLYIMNNTTIGSNISEKINEVVPALSSINTIKISGSQSLADIFNENPLVKNAVSENPVLEQLLSFTSKASDTSAMYAETVTSVNDFIVYSLLRIMALIVIFIAVKLIVVIIGKLLTSVLNSSAILGTANRTAGMAVGFTVGILVCYMVFILLIPVLGALNIVKVPEAYPESFIINFASKIL